MVKGESPFMKYLRRDRLPTIFCAGCGNGIVMNTFFNGMEMAEVDFDNLILVSGIGCSSRIPGYVACDSLHTTHGRPISFATGIKLANPEHDVAVFSGDGDAAAIGGNHLIHGARRNIDITVICINNSIFADPGRQIIYRTKHGFVPGPFERSYSKLVPETVAITEDNLLVGCMRNSRYAWSDDLGLTWFPLEGIPESITKGLETYQPWIQYLGNGRFANAGHYGHDNFYGEMDQYLMIHFFRVEQLRKTRNTRIDLVRDFDEAKSRWKNAYTLTLTCDGQPLAGKELEFWFVERGKPGYDDAGKLRLEERMRMGGETIRVTTGNDGIARVGIPRLDAITYIHHDIQLIARFNADRRDPEYKPAQTLEFQFYSNQVY